MYVAGGPGKISRGGESFFLFRTLLERVAPCRNRRAGAGGGAPGDGYPTHVRLESRVSWHALLQLLRRGEKQFYGRNYDACSERLGRMASNFGRNMLLIFFLV